MRDFSKFFKQKNLLSLVLIIGFLLPSAGPNVFIAGKIGATVAFQSNYPNSNLHFWLYGDGYYGKRKSPTRDYKNSSTGYEAVYYTIGDKEVDEPEDFVLPTGPIDNPNPGFVYNPPMKARDNIDIKKSWNITTYAMTWIMVHYENKFDVDAVDGCVHFNYDPEQIEVLTNSQINSMTIGAVGTTSPFLNYNDWAFNIHHDPNQGRITWQFEDLVGGDGDHRILYIPVKGFIHQDVNDVDLTASILKDCNDPPVDRVGVHFEVVGYPHDPNYKHCLNLNNLSHTSEMKKQYGEEEGEWEQYIIYEIQFHNEGTAPVQNVTVKDYLPAEIDPNSVELLSSDHYCELDLQTTEFYFPNIWLPGTGQGYEYEETISQFRFKACITDEIIGNQCLTNGIDIYFNNLPPIPASHTICALPTGPNDEGYAYGNPCNERKEDRLSFEANANFEIYPNPVKDYLFLKGIQKGEILTMRILSVDGKIMLQKQAPTNDLSIDSSNLPKGLYYLSIESSSKGFLTQKFIKH